MSKFYLSLKQNGQSGFSFIEVLVVTGIMGVTMLAMTTMQGNQMKANNFLEFQLKRTQLQGTLIGQFLKDPNNCACLFSGATAFSGAGIGTLAGAAPTQIGPYTSAAPGCGAPTQSFINGTGIDGLKATSIRLQNIAPTATPNVYTGSFNINIQSTKEVMGPKDLPISIPVSIATSPAGANVNFASCSSQSEPAPYATWIVVPTSSCSVTIYGPPNTQFNLGNSGGMGSPVITNAYGKYSFSMGMGNTEVSLQFDVIYPVNSGIVVDQFVTSFCSSSFPGGG